MAILSATVAAVAVAVAVAAAAIAAVAVAAAAAGVAAYRLEFIIREGRRDVAAVDQRNVTEHNGVKGQRHKGLQGIGRIDPLQSRLQ